MANNTKQEMLDYIKGLDEDTIQTAVIVVDGTKTHMKNWGSLYATLGMLTHTVKEVEGVLSTRPHAREG